MGSIFEQFKFVVNMFNFNDIKVRLFSLLSSVVSILIVIYMNIKNIILDYFGLTIIYVAALFIIMITDFITGVLASRYEGLIKYKETGEKWKLESKKGLRWVIRFITYMFGFYVINVLTLEANVKGFTYIIYILDIIEYYLMIYIVFWELKSIDENLTRMDLEIKPFGHLIDLLDSLSNKFRREKIDNNKLKDKSDE